MEETQRKRTLINLPHDIIQEILLLLPVKSILRFKCVSKSWCALISSESFVRAHLSKSSADSSFARFKMVTSDACEPRQYLPFYFTSERPTAAISDRARRHFRRRCSPAYLSGEVLDNAYDFYYGALIRRSNVVRSCNGLVCDFSINGKDFTLRNPSTKRYKKLPPANLGKRIYGSQTSCGFGYVESSNDYKVFALSLQRKIDGVFHYVAKVYSLKTDCWRTVDDNYKLETPMDLTARYCRGMLYWLRMFRRKENQFLSWEIISFDLEKEAFGVTVGQPVELEGELYTPQLGVFRGSLCVLCISFKFTDIWVLKQHATPFWTKVPVLPNTYRCYQFKRLAVSTDGAIFREREPGRLFYYLPNDTCTRNLSILDLDVLDRVCVHVESLVSLGNSEEAGVRGSIIDFEMEKRRLDDLDDDDDDEDDDDGDDDDLDV